jgi:hypothetical protein
MNNRFTPREQVIEVCNRLFVYTDERNWPGLIAEVFADRVAFDMTSAGGPQDTLTAQQICDMWAQGFTGLDAVHHQAGTYLVNLREADQVAEVRCYAIASHYKAAATQGTTREMVGNYDLHLTQTAEGWRLDGFTYHLKYARGNMELR